MKIIKLLHEMKYIYAASIIEISCVPSAALLNYALTSIL